MIRTAKVKKTAIMTAVFFSALLILGRPLPAQSLSALDQEISKVIHQVSGGVVSIKARPPENKAPVFPGQEISQNNPIKTVIGSGLLLDSLGHILTILSLVDGYDDFRVVINNQSKTAQVIGIDRRYNLAVLKIDGIFSDYLEISQVPPLVGRFAIGFGHAFGRTGFPTLGIIAGRRSDGSYLMSGTALPGLLGGGIFDLAGNLVGVIISGSITDGGLADNLWGGIVMLPASTAYAAADRIICCGDREAGYLGIKTSAIELVSVNGQVLGEGVVVSHVAPGSPAAKAGLKLGDIITHCDSRAVTNDLELQRMIAGAGSGNLINIDLIRGREDMKEQIRLAKFPNDHNIKRHTKAVSDRSFSTDPIDLRRRVDSLQNELARIQKELDILMQRVDLSY